MFTLFFFPNFANSRFQLLFINVVIISVLVIFLITTKDSKKKQTTVTAIFVYFALTLTSSSTRLMDFSLISSEDNIEEFDQCSSVLRKKGETSYDAAAKCGLLN